MSREFRRKAEDLMSRERGTVFRGAGDADVRIALAYPNVYRVGMSNLGFQTIYRHFNRTPGVACERVFLPEPGDEREMRRRDDVLRSLETGRPVPEFDILAFSVSFENDYVHLLRILDLSRLPPLARDRAERHPLVLVGGAITFLNPEPLADFADVIVIGEGEETSDRYLEAFRDDRGRGRRAHLDRAAALPGVYIPSLTSSAEGAGSDPSVPEPVARRQRDDPAEYVAYSAIVTDRTEFRDMFLIEITRGCPRRCRFCAVSYVYPKFRAVPAGRVLEIVRACRSEYGRDGRPGFDRVGLVSSAVCDYRETDTLCGGLLDMGLRVSVSSLRIDLLTDGLLDALVRSGQETMTIAPEAGSERLRRTIRKPMTDEQILDGVSRALSRGIRNYKIYAMVGLPTETPEDLQALVDLTRRIRREMRGRQGRKAGRLALSLNPFIPKPLTPFQWCGMEPMREIKRRVGILRRGIGGAAEIAVENYRSAYLEGILARGGRELSAFLLAIGRCDGDWKRAARETGLEVDAFLAERPDRLAPQPWDLLYAERERERLDREYGRALNPGVSD
jgi:radical SAM superfamily enzyme YgiQ (UPF0313 family)